MKFIADLHIHSRYSRATSRDLEPVNLARWSRIKGISVLGTGDFTHPEWLSELKDKLIEREDGLYGLRKELEEQAKKGVPDTCKTDVRFIISGEISCIYKKGGSTRKLHHLVLMPNFESAERFNQKLSKIGNIRSDGRPILGLDSRNLLEILLETSPDAFLIPAHVWTPWFSLFGSKSGFDSIEECFEDLTPYIHALETGLSSDPPMNRLLSSLDGYKLISNSDAHSASKIGREANIFDAELNYKSIIDAMKTGKGLLGTIEFFPEEGKYHLDGHRKCQIRFHPHETISKRGICPLCEKLLTIGVLHRVYELADRKKPEINTPYYSLIPLDEILAEITGAGSTSKKVVSLYNQLISQLGSELKILLELDPEEINSTNIPILGEAIKRMREGRVIKDEGFDGRYGRIRLFDESEISEIKGQMGLFKSKTKKRKPLPKTTLPIQTREKEEKYVLQKPLISKVQDLVSSLNEEQKDAVTFRGVHLLVIAGPGTGKTLTLTHRIAHLIHTRDAKAEDILAITFTNRASDEMRQRLNSLLGGERCSNIFIGTFHSFCYSVLKTHGKLINIPSPFRICSEIDSYSLLNKIAQESDIKRSFQRTLYDILPSLKRLHAINEVKDDIPQEIMDVFQKYQITLRENNMLDLDDLEAETLRLFLNCPNVVEAYGKRFKWVFIDEYQDINSNQADIIRLLVNKGGSILFAIGDPDQSIYGFRGSQPSCFYSFERDFKPGRVIELKKNYRSTPSILKASSQVMEKERALDSMISQDSPILLCPCRSYREEAEMIVECIERLMGGSTYFAIDSGRAHPGDEMESIGFGDIGILFRINAQGDEIENALSRSGIPYVRAGSTPLFDIYPINIIWRFLQVLRYPENRFYKNEYIRLCKKHIKLEPAEAPVSMGNNKPTSELIEYAIRTHDLRFENELSMHALSKIKEIAIRNGNDLEGFLNTLSLERGMDSSFLMGDRVSLMSIHSSKGLEWSVVFLTGCEDGLIPCTLFGNKDIDEEKRLLYVGMTRAKERLIISYAGTRLLFNRKMSMRPSPFLSKMGKETLKILERNRWKPKKDPNKQLSLF